MKHYSVFVLHSYIRIVIICLIAGLAGKILITVVTVFRTYTADNSVKIQSE
jgi:hypothetical protein